MLILRPRSYDALSTILFVGGLAVGTVAFFLFSLDVLEGWTALLFFLAAPCCLVFALLTTLVRGTPYCWIGQNYFGYRSCWPHEEVDVTFKIVKFAGVEREGAEAVIKIEDGERIRIPAKLAEEMGRLEEVLWVRRSYLLGEMRLPRLQDHLAPQPATPWPSVFTFEQSRTAAQALKDSSDVNIDDPELLRSLIHQYRAAAIFRESFPPAFDMVKIFLGLKRSNGGLVLIGVQPSGKIVGLPEEELADAQHRLEHLAAELTQARVEIGRIELDGKFALFAVFNATSSNTRPLDSIETATSEIVIV